MTDDEVEIRDAIWNGARIVGRQLERPELTSLQLTECDLAGVGASAFAVRRCELTGTRIRDCVWSGGVLQDTRFDACMTERSSLRFSTLQRVSMTGCSLAGFDFYGATFEQVVIEHCDLSGAKFDHAKVKSLRLHDCVLAGVTGALSLKGADIDLDDLAALAPSLARELGIVLR